MTPLCPIRKDFVDVQFTARNLAHKMSRLRRQLRRCRECQGADCPVLKEFNSAVQAALQEVAFELGIIKRVK
jgi:hypothetical protein